MKYGNTFKQGIMLVLMEKNIPAVSVVMPVYNGEKFIEETINSILNQTFNNFEFIIVNDGSKDGTLKIIKKFKDKRIRLIENKVNMGFVESVNVGIRNAKGKYIACSNADDLSHPKRIDVEYNYLESHPEIFLVGASAIFVDEKGKEIRRFRKYNNYKMLAWRLRKSCSIAYPSIMFRNEGFLMDKSFGGAADYHLYYQMLKKGKNVTNLPNFLLKYRVHPNNMTIYNSKQQEMLRDRVIEKYSELKDNINIFEKAWFSILLGLHYIRTMKEKKMTFPFR